MKRALMAGVVLALGSGLGACVDLDEKLVSNISNEYIKTPSGLNDATNAIYTRLRGYYGREQMMALSDMGTDAMTNGDQVSGGAQAWFYLADYSSGLNSTDGRVQATWNNFYIMIANANVVITNGETTPLGDNLTQEIKDSRLGEARFLRALAYFELVRFFGDLTLTLEPPTEITTEATRQPEQEVYAQIITDLEQAITLLPIDQADWGRARRGAAQHLLAKVYLTRAYRPWNAANEQADFQAALTLANTVITSGDYTLVPNYKDLWCGQPPADLAAKDPLRQSYCNTIALSGYSEQNEEIIFSVQYAHDPTQYAAAWCGNGSDCANYIHLVYLTRYDNDNNIGAGLARDLQNGRPFRRNRTTDYAHAVFAETRWDGVPGPNTPIMDTRHDGTFQTLWFSTNGNANGNSAATGGYWADQVCPNCSSGAAIAVGDTALWMPGYPIDDAFRQAHAFSIYEPCPTDPTEPCGDHFTSPLKQNKQLRIYGWEVSPSIRKHQDNGRRDTFDQSGGKDWIVMRLGETYLIAAEAAVGLGQGGTAADYVNTLRDRAATAAYKGPAAPFAVSAADMTLDFIMDERIRELHAEGMRWQDLVRPGAQYFVDRISATNPDARTNIQMFHALRPIPQEQINGVTGTPYPQNQGY